MRSNSVMICGKQQRGRKNYSSEWEACSEKQLRSTPLAPAGRGAEILIFSHLPCQEAIFTVVTRQSFLRTSIVF